MHDYNRYDNEIICPYCGHHFTNSQDIIDRNERDRTKITCPKCVNKFWGFAHISVEYSTARDCEINGNECVFERIKQLQMTQCKYCGKLKGLEIKCLIEAEKNDKSNV